MSKPARIFFFQVIGPPGSGGGIHTARAVATIVMTGAALAILLVIIAILIFCSALFSGLETALFSLKPHQLRRLAEHRAGLTKFVQLFQENPRRILNVLLLGDGLVNVPLVILCLVLLWEGPFASRIPQWADRNCDLRDCCGDLRFNSKAAGALRAVWVVLNRGVYIADFNAAPRPRRSRAGACQHLDC